MRQAASDILSTLNAGQEDVALTRRVPVAVGLLVTVAVMNIAAVLTTLM